MGNEFKDEYMQYGEPYLDQIEDICNIRFNLEHRPFAATKVGALPIYIDRI